MMLNEQARPATDAPTGPAIGTLLRMLERIESGSLRVAHGEAQSQSSVMVNWLYRFRLLLNRNSIRGSRRNIAAHYDLGNDFYRLWLDPSMTYYISGLRIQPTLLAAV